MKNMKSQKETKRHVKPEVMDDFVAAVNKRMAELDAKRIKVHANVKCDCGHPAKDHYQNSGYCHHSKHPKAGQCGCTWFHPNVRYCLRQQKKAADMKKLGK